MRAPIPGAAWRWAAGAAAALGLAACGGLVEATRASDVTVLLRATGGASLEVVEVAFAGLELEAIDGARAPLALRRAAVNLLHLQLRWDTVGGGEAPPNRYGALRIGVRGGYVVLRQRDSTFVVYATPGFEVPPPWAALKPRLLECELCGRLLAVPLPGAQLDVAAGQRATVEVEVDLDSSLRSGTTSGRVAAPEERLVLQPTFRVRAVRVVGGS